MPFSLALQRKDLATTSFHPSTTDGEGVSGRRCLPMLLDASCQVGTLLAFPSKRLTVFGYFLFLFADVV